MKSVRQNTRSTGTIALVAVIVLGMSSVFYLAHLMDQQKKEDSSQFSDEQLYLSGGAAKRLALGFNGLAADWYWMRSLQYLGRKLVNHADSQSGPIPVDDLRVLNLRQLSALLRVTTALDPQFMAAYQFGATILPTFDSDEAIALLNYGIEKNPDKWRLYQHLGYVHWQRRDYEKASQIYNQGAALPDAPRWMAEMGARVAAEGGSHRAAREMYQHLLDEATDDETKALLTRRLLQVDSFEQQDVIRRVIADFQKKQGRCPASWKEIVPSLLATGLSIDRLTGAPIDPAGTPYVLVKQGCEVDVDPRSSVPYR